MDGHFPTPLMESLEPRTLLSAPPAGLSPAQVRHAYGFDQITFTVNGKKVNANGAGQTIAIVDACNAPRIVRDLKVFDKAMGLSDYDAHGKFVLSRAVPRNRPLTVDAGWALETALDVEWAHAIAPGAHILLVSAPTASTGDLLAAIDYARNQKGVVAVSLSWGGDESPFETWYDQDLITPAGHIGGSGLRGGITFVSSSGDDGALPVWPAVSPNVVAVGGTTLRVGASNGWKSESAWAGSGGGYSVYEPTTTHMPDVAYNADPQTGFAVYDDTAGNRGWQVVGGTSAGAPQWAALVALVDQGRALQGAGSLETQQTLEALYGLPWKDFHDITTGSNGFAARPGYDLVTGRGTPVASRLVPGMVAATATRRATSRAPAALAAVPQPAVLAANDVMEGLASWPPSLFQRRVKASRPT